MKILSIGNSFSVDATRYFYSLAKENGIELKNVNLYSEGCNLESHCNIAINERAEEVFQFNGEETKMLVSLKQVLKSEEWDYITFQQASFWSPDYSTYQPYLNKLISYVKEYLPNAKIVLHQTWAYKEGSVKLVDRTKYKTHIEMFSDVKKAYNQAVEEIKPFGLIPCGEVVKNCNQKGLNMFRDDLHLSLGTGRFALALTWLCYFYKLDAKKVKLCKFDEPISKKDVKIVKKIVNEVLGR